MYKSWKNNLKLLASSVAENGVPKCLVCSLSPDSCHFGTESFFGKLPPKPKVYKFKVPSTVTEISKDAKTWQNAKYRKTPQFSGQPEPTIGFLMLTFPIHFEAHMHLRGREQCVLSKKTNLCDAKFVKFGADGRSKFFRRKWYIWNRRPQFAYSLWNFHWAMIIKDSLLLNIPTVKHFRVKSKSKSSFWPIFWRF